MINDSGGVSKQFVRADTVTVLTMIGCQVESMYGPSNGCVVEVTNASILNAQNNAFIYVSAIGGTPTMSTWGFYNDDSMSQFALLNNSPYQQAANRGQIDIFDLNEGEIPNFTQNQTWLVHAAFGDAGTLHALIPGGSPVTGPQDSGSIPSTVNGVNWLGPNVYWSASYFETAANLFNALTVTNNLTLGGSIIGTGVNVGIDTLGAGLLVYSGSTAPTLFVDTSGNVTAGLSLTTPTANVTTLNAGTITDTNLTASTAVYADGSKILQSSTTTATELAKLHGGYPIPSLIGGSVVTNGDGTVEAVNPSSGALILANAAAYTGLFNSTSGSATPGYNGSPILTNYQYAYGTLSTNATNATADWLTPDMQFLILSCPVNLFDSTNRTASIGHVKRIKFYPSGGNNYTISVTNVNWHWPISETGVTNHTVTNGFFGMLTLECDGNSETNVSAVWTDFK